MITPQKFNVIRSIRTTFRKCEHCGHRYIYNPSTGNFGFICPKCHKAQSKLIP